MKKLSMFFVGLFVCAFLFSGCSEKSYLEFKNTPSKEVSKEVSKEAGEALEDGSLVEEPPALEEPSEIYVQLTGALVNPGVYKVKAHTRLFEVVSLAGGLRPDAAESAVNQAVEVVDGQNIYFPGKDEFSGNENMENGIQTARYDEGRVNINTAGEVELMSLPGIGSSKAKQIIDYRETNGPYASIEDIMNIQGIKEGVFNKIKDSITVGI